MEKHNVKIKVFQKNDVIQIIKASFMLIVGTCVTIYIKDDIKFIKDIRKKDLRFLIKDSLRRPDIIIEPYVLDLDRGLEIKEYILKFYLD